MKKYNAALSNDSCVFDESFGFESISDAMRWAAGRGGRYIIQLDAGKCEQGECVSISYDDDAHVYAHYDGWEWVTIHPDKLESYIRQYI